MVLLPRIARTAGVAGAILAVAFLLFAVIFAATGDAPAAMVFIVVTSDEPDYVRKLYGTGALLVLPVRKSGCLVYRPSLPT
jgi:glycerol kinase